MSVTNYELRKTRAHYFAGPSSGGDETFSTEFKTTPELLRAVADWLDENNIQDPEFDGIFIHSEFSGRTNDYYGSDPYRQVAVVYYIDNPQPTPEQEDAHYRAMERQ